MKLDLIEGRWVNTNRASKWISRAVLEPSDGGVKARFVCAGVEWSGIEAPVFGEHPGDDLAAAFHGRYQAGALDVRMHAYVVKGVLVIISFARTASPEQFPAFMVKEFFTGRVSNDGFAGGDSGGACSREVRRARGALR